MKTLSRISSNTWQALEKILSSKHKLGVIKA